MKKLVIFLVIICLCATVVGCAQNKSDASYPYFYPYEDVSPVHEEWPEYVPVDESNPDVIVENPFISTNIENISTFSADVDTASYTYLRKLINSGYTLRELRSTAGDALRTEELINYFDYGYNLPNDDELFGVTAQIADCPWNNESVLLILGLKTEKIAPTSGNNLVFLIDVSGSMGSDDKLALLKESFSYLVGQLNENDFISIVTYSGNEEIVLEGCKGNRGEKIMKEIESLEAQGSTNGEAGLKMAYQLAEKYYIQGGNNRIIMASDGDLNVGISSDEELESFVSQKRDQGVYLSVLGFGTGNYRDSKMETIADNGNGVYYYIDSEIEAEKIFGSDLISTLYTVAGDVKLQLTFDAECVSEYRLIGYENRMLNTEDFEDDTKDAGEVGAGHTVTVCYELMLTQPPEELNEQWMNLAIRYKRLGETKSSLNEYPIGIESYTDQPNDDFYFVSSIIELSMILRQSEYMGNLSLEDVMALLEKVDLTLDSYKSEFAELVQELF